MMKINDRFTLIKQLGQGSFSTIYSAEDKLKNVKVALKIEKPDKSKRILMFEYDVLKQLQDCSIGLNHTPQVFEFVDRKNQGQNFIVMRLLGKNMATQKKLLCRKMTTELAINYLIQMLDAIEEVHNRGFIHRDIKPSNFVIGKDQDSTKVFIVDFGLAKQHLFQGVPVQMRPQADFRGTIIYASLNAHLKIDLSRRDDLWSFYFVILDFLNEILPWRNNSVKDEVKDIKIKCLANPEKYLWTTYTKGLQPVKDIFYHLKNLEYVDTPNYQFIREKLLEIQNDSQSKQINIQQISPKYTILSSPSYIYQQPNYVYQQLNSPNDYAYHQNSLQNYTPSNRPVYQVHQFDTRNAPVNFDNQQIKCYNKARQQDYGNNHLQLDNFNIATNLSAYQPQQQYQIIDYKRPLIYQQPLQQSYFTPINTSNMYINQGKFYQQQQQRNQQGFQVIQPQKSQPNYEPIYINNQQTPQYIQQTSNDHGSQKFDIIEQGCSQFLGEKITNNESFNDKLFEQNRNIGSHQIQGLQSPMISFERPIQSQQQQQTSSSANKTTHFNPFKDPPYTNQIPKQLEKINTNNDYASQQPQQIQFINQTFQNPIITNPQEIIIQPQPVYIHVQEAPQIFIQTIQPQNSNHQQLQSNVTTFSTNHKSTVNNYPQVMTQNLKRRDQKLLDKLSDPRKQQYENVKRSLLNEQHIHKKQQQLNQQKDDFNIQQAPHQVQNQQKQEIDTNHFIQKRQKIDNHQYNPHAQNNFNQNSIQVMCQPNYECQDNFDKQHDLFKIETDQNRFQHLYGHQK